LKPTDTVLEIGPGLGFLTKRLADRAGEVLAVEKDRMLVRVLKKIFKNKKNIKIIYGDVLRLLPELVSLAESRRVEGLPFDSSADGRIHSGSKRHDFKVVANIPYYLTGKILQDFLSAEQKPALMVLLLQKEVAERVVAKPGDMSMLAVSVQFYSDPEIIDIVPKDNFYPIPEVDSAIVRMRVLARPRFDVNEKKFFQLVKIGFANKRKQLHNNLQAMAIILLPSPGEGRVAVGQERLNYKDILSSLGLNPLCRAQDLSLSDWEGLYRRLVV